MYLGGGGELLLNNDSSHDLNVGSHLAGAGKTFSLADSHIDASVNGRTIPASKSPTKKNTHRRGGKSSKRGFEALEDQAKEQQE